MDGVDKNKDMLENEKVLKIARDRLDRIIEKDGKNRERMTSDMRFISGDQWPDDIRTERAIDQRPCLTINKLGQYVRQIVNDSRQNSPSIRVFPTGEGGDQKVAEIFNGMIRDVEQTSDSDVAYDTAIESAARVGVGYFGLVSQYAGEASFVQELAFRRFRNYASIYIDEKAQDPAGKDMRYAFVSMWMNKNEFEALYKKPPVSLDNLAQGDNMGNWLNGDDVRLAEYYSLEEVERTLALLKGGGTKYLEESAKAVDMKDVIKTRKTKVVRCKWRLISGQDVLEETIWPSRYVPIFRVIGEEFDVDGDVQYNGIVRPSKDSQRMYNYWVTNATEMVALAPKAPFVGAEGQFEGHEQQWKAANRKSYAYLEYKPTTLDEKLVPPPQRQHYSQPPLDALQLANVSTQDMKESAGMYNSSMGREQSDQSGRAIAALQRKSDTGTFHYVDNLTRAMRQCGRVMVEVIPKFYDTQRVVRIVGEDDIEKNVTVNETKQVDGVAKVMNDLTVGRYDVKVATGGSYATRRLEAADSMMQFINSLPQAGEAIMDIVAQSMDWPGADKIAARLRKMIPPNLISDEAEGEGEGFTPAQVEAMIAEAVQGLQQQFQQSIENREVEVKEFGAQTDRLEAIAKTVPDEGQLREMVSGMLAEFVNELTGVKPPA